MELKQTIVPFLWFDSQAEEAARFYIETFPDSRILQIDRYPATGEEVHRMPAGSVMTVRFEIGGLQFTALNGGPLFKFTEAVSFQVACDTQAEIDHYWEKLGSGGDPKAQ
jgi:predicted 3-demethylubiquinone-9 3-methyltransferase (glyoxalase superfamily)